MLPLEANKQLPNSYESNDGILQDILYLTFPFFIRGLLVDQLAMLEIPVSHVGISYWAGSDTWKLWGVSFHLGNKGDSHKSRWGNAVFLDISKCMTRYCWCFCSGLFLLSVWGIQNFFQRTVLMSWQDCPQTTGCQTQLPEIEIIW